ncbi:aminodeoxychorismate lyase [Nitrincola nitratireducens]|uniref:Aminodeoxychorismate lyase n=1 Tax=Nitrincola nitratireducens TaxID=1229521 RepID=W9VLG1_9GAMM|nr:aminodeoxychorismate lyase [Nitrincola nitratireducens]EXJ11365.1 Aminodeoxychorismate lyase [Nitrincola nitratireducens]
MMQSSCWVNGVQAEHISVTDRGLSYGHGVFETLPIEHGTPLLWSLHRARMVSSCQRLGIPIQSVVEAVEQDIRQFLANQTGVLRITITCGEGLRGYRMPDTIVPTRILQYLPPTTYPNEPARVGIKAMLCQQRLGLSPSMAGMKHLNRLEQVLARSEWQTPDLQEGVVCDIDDYVIEGTMSNLFMVKAGELHTPSLDRCGVWGVMRQHLLHLAERESIVLHEGRYRLDDLLASDEVFFCNSLIGIWPLVELSPHSFVIGPVTRKLQALLEASYRVC